MLKELESRIGYTFREPCRLEEALTHSSFTNEHRETAPVHNERMEFLGDAVLELASSQYLYTHFPDEPEGVLSRHRAAIVCEPSLAACARKLVLGRFLRMGKGEEKTGGRERDSILSDAFEALIGAVYLDGGFNEAVRFINRFVMQPFSEHPLYSDAKTRFQEKVQKDGEVQIVYDLLSEEGPEHDKIFTVQLSLNGRAVGIGKGHTKKAAEQAAAAMALEET